MHHSVPIHNRECFRELLIANTYTIQPSPEILFSFYAPQHFVLLYAILFGKGGHVVVIVLAVLALWFNTAVAVLSASRLVFAVARDGILPFSGWVSKVSPFGQPQNVVIVVRGVAAFITCSILPSSVAFTSLISVAGVPSAATYRFIAFGRFFITGNKFPKPR